MGGNCNYPHLPDSKEGESNFKGNSSKQQGREKLLLDRDVGGWRVCGSTQKYKVKQRC